MKKITYCLIALFITLMVSVASLEAATEITALPYTITTQGSYIINKNLTSTRNGIVVQANNVTIDLNGYYIAGNNSGTYHGIYMNGRSDVEIRNGIIRNFGSNGVFELSSSGNSHRVINVRIMKNGANGIVINGDGSLVKDCTVSDNGGFGILANTGSIVIGNIVNNNGSNGIQANSSGVTVIGNNVSSNGGSGIYASSGSTVKNNTSCLNMYHGMQLSGYNLVDGNTAYINAQSGSGSNMSPCATCVFGDNVAP